MKKLLLTLLVPAGLIAAESAPGAFNGRIERLDPVFDKLVAPGAAMEKVAEGFTWAEGPLWPCRQLFRPLRAVSLFAYYELLEEAPRG